MRFLLFPLNQLGHVPLRKKTHGTVGPREPGLGRRADAELRESVEGMTAQVQDRPFFFSFFFSFFGPYLRLVIGECWFGPTLIIKKNKEICTQEESHSTFLKIWLDFVSEIPKIIFCLVGFEKKLRWKINQDLELGRNS